MKYTSILSLISKYITQVKWRSRFNEQMLAMNAQGTGENEEAGLSKTEQNRQAAKVNETNL